MNLVDRKGFAERQGGITQFKEVENASRTILQHRNVPWHNGESGIDLSISRELIKTYA